VAGIYLPKTDEGKKIDELMGVINTAQDQWFTYADQLARGYNAAYGWHQKTLDDIDAELKLKAEQTYWLLSLLCVAFAGGVAGGLMAPWVNAAGKAAADAAKATTQVVVRNKVSATIANSAQGIVQKVTDIAKPEVKPFVPAVKDRFTFFLDMHGELGKCFSDLRKAVQEDTKDADGGEFSLEGAKQQVEKYMSTPLLKYSPTSDDLPDETVVARDAELGMWIAWAGCRDIDYWNKAIADWTGGFGGWVQPGNEYLEDAEKFQPVVDRLRILGSDALSAGTIPVKVVNKSIRPARIVINIPKLAGAGYTTLSRSGDNLFLQRVSEVVKFPKNVLPQLDQNRPIYRDH
jgi:hypothetical protein